MNALTGQLALVRQAIAVEKARARKAIRIDETGFLPAALEVVERPVSPTARITAYVLLAGLVVMLLWLCFGRVDVVASAPGKIVPADNIKIIQSSENGIVRRILVREGQRVRRGQPLVMLDPTSSTAELTQARQALASAELDAARARAVIGALNGRGFAFVPPAGLAPDIAATHEQLARAQLSQIQAGMSVQSAGAQAAAASVAEARQQAAKLTETIPLLDEQLAANEKLLEKGFVSKLRVIEMRRQRLAAIRDRDIAMRTATGASANMAAASSGAVQNGAQARATILAELTKAEADVALRREELVKSERRSTLQQLVAPVDGTVAQLAIHTEGGVIEAARPIMAIVPAGSTLIAEVKLLNRDMGYIQEGQEVAVKLEAFPFTRFGTIPGRVIGVGSDAIPDEKLGPIYVARVALARMNVDRGDRLVPILPGMVAIADIKTGRRSFMSYLLSPIDEARQEAVRER